MKEKKKIGQNKLIFILGGVILVLTLALVGVSILAFSAKEKSSSEELGSELPSLAIEGKIEKTIDSLLSKKKECLDLASSDDDINNEILHREIENCVNELELIEIPFFDPEYPNIVDDDNLEETKNLISTEIRIKALSSWKELNVAAFRNHLLSNELFREYIGSDDKEYLNLASELIDQIGDLFSQAKEFEDFF